MAEDEKPLFLTEEAPEDYVEPETVVWNSPSMGPFRPLTPRQREACRLVASGMTYREAAKKSGYSESRVANLCKEPRARREILRLQDKLFEKAVVDRIKDLGTPAMDVFEEVLTTDDPEVKSNLKLDAAKWIAEKITGKPKQEIEVGGSVVVSVLDSIRELKESGQIIDVTPQRAKAQLASGEEVVEEEISADRRKLDAFLDSDL